MSLHGPLLAFGCGGATCTPHPEPGPQPADLLEVAIVAGETVVTVVGNLTADPELRFTPSGLPVANFTVASTLRTYDRQAGEWMDGDALFMRCSLWQKPAENLVESLTKGTRVIVRGRLEQRSFETREGEKRTVVELAVDEVGPSLRYATAAVTKTLLGSSRGGALRESAAVATAGNAASGSEGEAPF